ncbi:hypothetical protein [Escherichia coli]|uniref:hypothetical protein n=1 Tax=Escherichia coli TaxID=562 RepID=UPI0032E91B46
MDEAFSALDPLIRTEMQDELVKLQAKHQRTIVFISHDLDEGYAYWRPNCHYAKW